MNYSLRYFVILILSFFMLSGCSDDDTLNPQPPTADAGSYQPFQPSTNSITLSGTGTTTNGHITGYIWSLISGPNLPEIMTPSSQTTAVNNVVAGTYSFQFAVVDDAGLTGIDTAQVIILPSTTTGGTITLQPVNNPWEWEFYGNSTFNGSGHATQIDATAWTSGGPVAVRGAVHFDLSGIPAGATISSAHLSLYSTPDPQAGNLTDANYGNDNAFYIRQINSAWTADASATWQNQPTTTTANQVSVPHTNLSTLDLDIDVTPLVIAMHNGNNYGFMFQLQNETAYNSRQFCSSIHADASKHPKLVVVYN